jgi:peptidoglycan/LPS O-acetylase OafA/YrhL
VYGARRLELPRRIRADLAALVGIFAIATTTALLNGALEGPYMSLFFWLPLGLLIVIPSLYSRAAGARERAVKWGPRGRME